jgi:hypothetical protein
MSLVDRVLGDVEHPDRRRQRALVELLYGCDDQLAEALERHGVVFREVDDLFHRADLRGRLVGAGRDVRQIPRLHPAAEDHEDVAFLAAGEWADLVQVVVELLAGLGAIGRHRQQLR